MDKESVKKAVSDYISPAKVLGDISLHENKWRALVAGHPSGPLVLVEFSVSERIDNEKLDDRTPQKA
jgi:hypothetical protein